MVTTTQAREVLLGVLYGDCLGAQYEFTPGPLTGAFHIGPSVFGHPAGTGTDDTETTLAVAEAIVSARQHQTPLIGEVAAHLVAWLATGPADVGGTTANGLRRYQQTHDVCSGSTAEKSIANGALMRSAPWALSGEDASAAVAAAAITHAHPTVLAGVEIYHDLLTLLLAGRTPARVLVALDQPGRFHRAGVQLAEPSLLSGPKGGFAPYALSLALWCGIHATDYVGGINEVVRQGGDTDTNAAICGAVLAARFGFPNHLAQQLSPARVSQIGQLAHGLTAVDGTEMVGS